MNDEERDRAIVKLQDHYAKNRIEVEELERRVEIAERARDGRELARALDGLPEVAMVVAPPPPTTVKVLLGSVSRRGVWQVPQRLVVRALLGSVDLDLSEAELARGETVVEVLATFGSVTIVIADDVEVACEGTATLGSFEHVGQRARSKRDPRKLRIVGRALCGSVDVVVRRRPPPSLLDEVKDGVRALLGGR